MVDQGRVALVGGRIQFARLMQGVWPSSYEMRPAVTVAEEHRAMYSDGRVEMCSCPFAVDHDRQVTHDRH